MWEVIVVEELIVCFWIFDFKMVFGFFVIINFEGFDF